MHRLRKRMCGNLKNTIMDTLIYKVREIFCEYLQKKGCSYYNIPEYQRGYKWTADNVKQLLDDLKNFKKGDSDSFYCIQNITITKTVHNGKMCMNVIDGQQRLTTLFILIAYLQRNMQDKIINLSSNILKYSIRDSSDEFLREDILTGNLWKNEINPDTAKTKDQYYMMTVAQAIHIWFRDNKLNSGVILDDLVLIVNEVENGDEEVVFASLNGGKIDLDGADLVRAILITRAAKQKYPSVISHEQLHQIANDDIDLNINIAVSSQGKINEFRVKLGIELDEMNKWWSQKKVKDYFEQILPNKIGNNQSFKYNQYPIDLLYYAFYEAYKEELNVIIDNNDLDLRIFENGIDLNGINGDDHLEFYTTIKEFHLTMMEWYNNDEIYNLIGYLMYNYKSTKISFDFLWKAWKVSNSKDKFVENLKESIKEQIARSFSGEDEIENALSNLRNAIKDISFDWYNNDYTLKLLPLIDIFPIEKKISKRTKTVISRIEPDYFRHIGIEDKEHVRSQKTREDNDLTNEEKKQLEEENKKGLNSIGNIVLLHEGINRSYKNKPHMEKMDRIISEFMIHDWYIRPHTFNVFTSKLESIDENGETHKDVYWSEDDIYRTVTDIDTRLAKFFNL